LLRGRFAPASDKATLVPRAIHENLTMDWAEGGETAASLFSGQSNLPGSFYRLTGNFCRVPGSFCPKENGRRGFPHRPCLLFPAPF